MRRSHPRNSLITYEFKGSGKEFAGKATHASSSSEIAEGRVEGDRVSFVENPGEKGSDR